MVNHLYFNLDSDRLFGLSLNAYYTSPPNQLKWLLYRNGKRMLRDPYYMVIKIGEAVALGFFLGGLFFQTDFDHLVVVSRKEQIPKNDWLHPVDMWLSLGLPNVPVSNLLRLRLC